MKKGRVKKFIKDNKEDIFVVGTALGCLLLGCGIYKNHFDKKHAACISEIAKDECVRVVLTLCDVMDNSDGFAYDFNRPWKIADLGKFGETMLAECPVDRFTPDTDLSSVIFTIKKQ